LQNLGIYFDKTLKQRENKKFRNEKNEKTWKNKEV
jgi:hypothetical protein